MNQTVANIQYCFPTAIFSTFNPDLADEMLPIARKFLDDDKMINKRWNYKTTYTPNTGIERFKETKSFCDYVANLGKDFLIKQGYELEFSDFKSLLFASEMFKGQFHNTHAHPNCVLSGVFYLQVPEGSSPIVFYDPRPFRKMVKRNTPTQTETNQDELVIYPQKGLLMMWESWLEHSVPENFNTEEGRVTLIFNLTKPI
jgi:hypothetical protein